MANIDDIKKSPLLLLLTVIIVIILLVGIFGGIAPSIGFGGYAHLGGVKGAFSFETFENSNQPTLAIFKTSWCGYCKKAQPDFDRLSSEYDGKIKIEIIDGDENKDLVKSQNVQGYPTIRFYPKGISQGATFKEYNDERTFDAMMAFLKASENVPAATP